MNKLFFILLIASVFSTLTTAQQRRTGTTSAPSTQTKTAPDATARPTSTPASPPPVAGPVAPRGEISVLAPNACGCEDKPLPAVLATVNGVKITQSDISPETQQRVNQLQMQVVEARRRELDLQIDSILLEAEAKKRGVSTTKILEDEIVAKTQDPTEAEAQAFYDQNKARVGAEFKDAKGDIISYLRYQRQQEQAKKLSERLRAAAAVKVLTQDVTPPTNEAQRARVFATVNGRNITSRDIEENLRPLIFSVQEQVYALRRQDVDLKINDILLQQEAQKKGVTSRAVLDTEVVAKLPQVTEAQAQTFYNENKERINGEFAAVKPQIIEYLKETEERKLTSSYAQQLRKAAAVQTFLTAPEPPQFDIATDDQPVKGNPSASVTVVEFTDFQCPSCAQQHPVLEKLATEYGERVRFVIRDFPLSQHANAVKAAEAAEAAREQGKYWEYAAILFRNQSALEVPKLKEYATTLGLDRAKFDAALDTGKFSEQVRRDVLDGQKFGVNGTPTLYVNGRRVSDRSYEGLKASIEAALKTPAKK
jgi:protein-disulfide isomerase